MKKHLNFDPKFRQEIESGQYKVETKSGLPVTILDWELKNYDRHDIVAKVPSKSGDSEKILLYYSSGRLISDSTEGPREKDLVIVSDIEVLDFDIARRPAIESGKLSAVTEFGEPVEIVKWDCKGKYPILAIIFDGDTDDSCFYDLSGTSISGSKLYLQGKEEERKPYLPETKKPEEIKVVNQEVPLTENEKLVKDAVLRCIENGTLGHIEVKHLTTYLSKLFSLDQKKEEKKEEKKSMWSIATSRRYYPNYKKGFGVLVVRKNLLGSEKIVVTNRVSFGEAYCDLESLGTIPVDDKHKNKY